MTKTSQTAPKPDWALTNREQKVAQAKAEGRKPPRRRWPWVVLVVIVAIVFAAKGGALTGTTEPQEAAPVVVKAEPREVVMQILPSELSEISLETLRETVRITGSLGPIRKLSIPAEVSGHVELVSHRAGDWVEVGDMLVRIDIETLRNQLEQSRATADATRAQLDYARTQLDRTQSLVDRGVATSSSFDSVTANVQQLEANLVALEQQVATAERSLDKATVTAPFSGIIAERTVDPGTFVSLGAPLLTLVDISSLELEGVVPVNYAPRITIGQAVNVTADGFGDQPFTGTVERIAPVAASGTRMLPIFATIDNASGALRGGMFASGVLVLEEKPDAIGISVNALRRDDIGEFVLKRAGDRVVRQAVTVARTWDQGRLVEVTEGLSGGDVIVSAPLERLQPEMAITVVED